MSDVCKKCGSDKPPDWQCSRCGGHGLVETMGGPDDCPACGCSGIQYPPVCPDCSAFRKAIPTTGTDAGRLLRAQR